MHLSKINSYFFILIVLSNNAYTMEPPLAGSPPVQPPRSATPPEIRDKIEVSLNTLVAELHQAILDGQTDTARGLLDRYMLPYPLNSLPDKQSTLLHDAIKLRRTEIVRILLKHGADANAQDKSGNTPLAIVGFTSEEMIRYKEIIILLAQYGASIPSNDITKKILSEFPLLATLLFATDAQVREFEYQDRLTDEHYDEQDLHAALIYASRRGYSRLIYIILSRMIEKDPTILWKNVRSAISYAKANEHAECFRAFAQFFANANQPYLLGSMRMEFGLNIPSIHDTSNLDNRDIPITKF